MRFLKFLIIEPIGRYSMYRMIAFIYVVVAMLESLAESYWFEFVLEVFVFLALLVNASMDRGERLAAADEAGDR